jgi:hypothetical protein
VNLRIVLLVTAAAMAGSLVQTETAEAGRYRFSGGGRVHARVGGSVGVSWARPAYRAPARSWSASGRIYAGPGVRYYPRYRYYPTYRYYYPRYYYYQPVPSYYGVYTQPYYYPVQPAPQPATTVAVTAPVERPDLPKLGVGLFAGGVSVEDQKDSSDIGLLGRYRITNGLIVEGELGKTTYEQDLRVDRRLGASLAYEIGAYNKLAPYVLAGLGVQQADVGGEYKSMQNFGELGVGLRYAFSPNFHMLFDVRAGTRATRSSDEPPVTDFAARQVTPPASGSGDQEDYVRARLAAVLYF